MKEFLPSGAAPDLAALLEGAGEGARDFLAEVTGGDLPEDPALARRLVQDVLALRGLYPAAVLAGWLGPLLVRAASALRAEGRAGQTAANGPEGGGVAVSAVTQSFRGFFAVEEYALNHSRFDGSPSGPLRREVFVSGDAVTVLPYDPERDLVLLIEQFRAGPLARGEGRPWLIEAIAGRIDPGESPAEAAQREAREEAGITLGPLLPVADYYPSPGILSEYLWSYVALSDLGSVQAGQHGLAAEGEDIRSHILPFDQAMDWLSAGRLANAPLILSLFWLSRERGRLRQPFLGNETGSGIMQP